MLLHIFRLEGKASLSGTEERAGSARAASLARRVEDINGRRPLRACETWKGTGYGANGTLALVSAAAGVWRSRSAEAGRDWESKGQRCGEKLVSSGLTMFIGTLLSSCGLKWGPHTKRKIKYVS